MIFFSYLKGMLHAHYMQIACPVQHMLARREHLKYSIHFGPLGLNIYVPTASPTILKCFTSCNCSMHVLLHVTSMLGVMLHDVTSIEKRLKSLHVTCNIHVQRTTRHACYMAACSHQ